MGPGLYERRRGSRRTAQLLEARGDDRVGSLSCGHGIAARIGHREHHHFNVDSHKAIKTDTFRFPRVRLDIARTFAKPSLRNVHAESTCSGFRGW